MKDENTKKTASVPVSVAAKQAKPLSSVSRNVASPDKTWALIKRGHLFLEDLDWQKAIEYFDRVLDIDPECAAAYVGLLCAELKVQHEESLCNNEKSISEHSNFKKAIRFADSKYKTKIEGYDPDIREHRRQEQEHRAEQERQERERVFLTQRDLLIQAMSMATTENEYHSLAERFRTMNGFKDTAELASECDKRHHTLLGCRQREEISAAFFAAVKKGNIRAINLSIAAGANVNEKDADGNLPIFIVAEQNSKRMVKALVTAGADINAKNKDGDTLLHQASRIGVYPWIRFLKELGANVNEKDADGKTPLELECEGSDCSSLFRQEADYRVIGYAGCACIGGCIGALLGSITFGYLAINLFGISSEFGVLRLFGMVVGGTFGLVVALYLGKFFDNLTRHLG